MRQWASHWYVILTIHSALFNCVFSGAVLMLRYVLNPMHSQNLFYYLALWFPNSLTLYWLCFCYEFMWRAWVSVVVCTFIVYWCADIFTMNDLLQYFM